MGDVILSIISFCSITFIVGGWVVVMIKLYTYGRKLLEKM